MRSSSLETTAILNILCFSYGQVSTPLANGLKTLILLGTADAHHEVPILFEGHLPPSGTVFILVALNGGRIIWGQLLKPSVSCGSLRPLSSEFASALICKPRLCALRPRYQVVCARYVARPVIRDSAFPSLELRLLKLEVRLEQLIALLDEVLAHTYLALECDAVCAKFYIVVCIRPLYILRKLIGDLFKKVFRLIAKSPLDSIEIYTLDEFSKCVLVIRTCHGVPSF